MEIADIFLVNKADREGADRMAGAITGMLHLAAASPGWSPPVLLTTAHTGQGIEDLWGKIQDHRQYQTTSGDLEVRRGRQRRAEFLEAVEEVLAQRLRNRVVNDPDLIAILEQVSAKKADPYSAALEYLESSLFSADWPDTPKA
jgi:LAO/AO transport system kinase